MIDAVILDEYKIPLGGRDMHLFQQGGQNVRQDVPRPLRVHSELHVLPFPGTEPTFGREYFCKVYRGTNDGLSGHRHRSYLLGERQ